jgi:hypothetical protein
MMPGSPIPLRAMDLFDAYARGQFPLESGCIVISRFSCASAYARYEIIAYSDVKSQSFVSDSLAIQARGKKFFLLAEPESYPLKSVDPDRRPAHERIPFPFGELDGFTAANRTRVYVSKKACDLGESFTVEKPVAMDFSILFFPVPDMLDTLQSFFEKSFVKEAGIPLPDAEKASNLIAKSLRGLLARDSLPG